MGSGPVHGRAAVSSFATSWAWKQQAGKAKAVLLALVEFADCNGICSVPQTHLAAMTEQSEKTVRRHLKDLEALKLIQRFEVRADDGAQMLDEIHLISRRPWRSNALEEPAVQGPDKMTGGPEMGADKMTGITSNNNSLDISSFTHNNSESEIASAPETEEAGGTAETKPETPTPDGAASGEARQAASSQVVSKNTHQDGGNADVKPSVNVPPPAATPFRAALNAIEAAGLTPTWVQWIKLNRLQQVSQEAQAGVWQAWIEGGQVAILKANVLDIVQSGEAFSVPWAVLKARMLKAATATAQALPTHVPFKPGHRVRYEDGSDALVLDVRARGITTDHPLYPDVPLSRLKTLELVR